MRIQAKILVSASIVTILSCGYIFGVPAIVNLPKHKAFFEQKIYENSGYKVDLGKSDLSMGSFPSVWVKSNSISLLNDDGSKALYLENPKVKLKLFPLLFKKIEITHISATKEDVNFVFKNDKKFYIGQYPLDFKPTNSKFKLTKVVANIGPYNISLDDNLNNRKILLKGEYFKHGKYIANKNMCFGTKGDFVADNKSVPYYFDMDVKLPINEFNKNKLKIFANVKDFDLSTISDYISVLTNGEIKKTKGIINFVADTQKSKKSQKHVMTKIDLVGLEVLGKDSVSHILYNDKLSFNINFDTINNGVNFKNTSISSKDFNFTLSGELKNSGKKFPAMDLKVEAPSTRLEKIVPILPWIDIFSDFDLYKLKKYVFYGNGVAKMYFKGNGDRPDVFGNVHLTDTYLIHPIKGAPAGADVKLNFRGSKMDVDVFVPTNNGQKVWVSGVADIDGSKYSELDIRSTDSVCLETAKEVLDPLHEIMRFKLGPVPLMHMKGVGSIKMRSAGKKIDPHMFGTINFRNSTASFDNIHNLSLTNASGEVNFKDTKIDFKTHSGLILGKPVTIKGDCDVLGHVNVMAETKNQNIVDILRVINTSPDLAEVQQVVKPFTKASGQADLLLNIYGIAPDAEKIVFNKDLFSKGTITLHNAKTTLQDTYLPLEKINGVVNFDKQDADYKLSGYVRNSKVNVTGTANKPNMDLTATSDKLKLADCFDLFYPKLKIPYKSEIEKLYVSFDSKYKGPADSAKLDYNKVHVDGVIHPNKYSNDMIKVFNNTKFTINNSSLTANGLVGTFYNNPFTLSFTNDNIYKNVSISNAAYNFKNFNLSSLNDVKKHIDLPKDMQKIVNDVSNIQGTTDIVGNIKNGNINSDIDLENVMFDYKPLDARVRVLSGKANMRNNVLYLGNINTRVNSMPLFVNGSISNVYKNPYLNLFVSAKPTQQFFDRIFNSKTVYPVKVKGDINFKSKLVGTQDRLHTNSELSLNENSSIYYMGATLSGAPTGVFSDDTMSTNPVTITTNAVLSPNKMHINSMQYNQIITSQNNKKSAQNQLSTSGDIELKPNNVLYFHNFKIKTNEPTDAKIFNILLKKPTIKQGVFTADLVINGSSLSPKAIGDLNITSVDVPLLSSTIRDIMLNFQKDYIYLKSRGNILTSEVMLNAKLVNHSVPPLIIEDMDIKADLLDLNVVTSAFNDFDADSIKNKQSSQTSGQVVLAPTQVLVKNAVLSADKILIKKADATNFALNFHVGSNHILNVDNYSFNIANGTVNGDILYDLANFKLFGNMHIKDADAQIISENFFDLPGQMYGLVTGDLNVECSGTSSIDCTKTLSGQGKFNVIDGRMPKLGSLEYLLKAGDLITGGLTGISINGIVDLITPLKTGNFDSISGTVHVKDGIADKIDVYSSGKDLNMYLTGSYNIQNLVADMEVYGSLSKNFSSLLGKIGNMSLNRMFNKIPGISINQINPNSTSNIRKIPNFNKENVLRVFKAEIFGDINSNNYVKSFRWIKD